MVKKTCPGCKGKSFSSSDTGEWKWPYCGTDLTKVKAEVAK